MADRSISVHIRAIVTDFQRAMGQATSDLKGFQSQAKLTGADTRQAMTTVGMAAAGAGLAVTAGLGAAAKAAVDWESAFAGVIKTVDATDAELAGLEQGLRSMAQEIPVSHAELAGIAEAAGQLGIETGNILDFTETMAALGTATNLTSEEAATMFARFANITQLPQDQIENLGSTVVDLGNNLATTEREIVEMGLRIAGAGAQIGLSEADILGFAGALSSLGIEAQAGGTAISRVFIEIDKAVRGGGDMLDEFSRVAGMSAEEFTRAYQDDAAGAIVTFVEGLGEVSAAGGDVFGVLEALGLQDIRVRDALLRMSGGGDLLRESLERSGNAFADNVALSKEAEQRYKTVASQIQIAKNALYELGITIGEIILPVLTPMIGAFKDLVTWFSNLPGPVKTAGVVLAGVSATLLTIAGTALILIPRILQLASAWKVLAASQAAGGVLGMAGRGLGFLGKAGAIGAAGFAGVKIGEFAAEKITGKPGDFINSLGSLLGNENATSNLRMQEAIHEVNTALDRGKPAALAFKDALAHLSLSGNLTVDSMYALSEATGVNIRDAQLLAQEMEAEARAAGWAEEDIQNLVNAITGGQSATSTFSEAFRAGQGYVGGYGEVVEETTGSVYGLITAQQDLASTLLEALNPVSQAVGAIQRYEDAQANLDAVRQDSESTAEDVALAEWELVEAMWAAQAAIDAVDPTSLDASIGAIASALEIGTDEAIELLNTLNLLDGMVVDTVVRTTQIFRNAGERDAIRNTIGRSRDQRAAGGPVAVGSMYRVGERNMPELLSTPSGLFMIPGESGRVFSNKESERMLGGTSLTINMQESGNFEVDAQRVAAMASLTRRMETL